MRRCKPLPLAEMRETWTYDLETGILRDKNGREVGYRTFFKRFDCFGKAVRALHDARLNHYGEFARHA